MLINGRSLAFLNRKETLCPGLEGHVWPGPPAVGADRAAGDTALATRVTKVLVVVSPETLVQLLQAQEGLLGPGLDQAQASGSRLECPDQSLATSLGRCCRPGGEDCGRPRRPRRLEPSRHVRILNLRGREAVWQLFQALQLQRQDLGRWGRDEGACDIPEQWPWGTAGKTPGFPLGDLGQLTQPPEFRTSLKPAGTVVLPTSGVLSGNAL